MIGTGKESHTFIHNNRDEHTFLGVGYKRDIFFAIKPQTKYTYKM